MGAAVVRLPRHPLLYTLDQVSFILNVDDAWLKRKLFYVGRSTGPHRSKLQTVNIEDDPKARPQWRVSEIELKRWLTHQGYRITEL